jgi:hypothetical protein
MLGVKLVDRFMKIFKDRLWEIVVHMVEINM